MYIDWADEAKLVKKARTEVFSGRDLIWRCFITKFPTWHQNFIQLCDNENLKTKICAAKTNKQTNNNHCSTHAPDPMSFLNRA